jgi:hypothetical protein
MLWVVELSIGSSVRDVSDFDFDRLLRVGEKLFWVLQKKFKDGSDAYMVVVLMVLYFEECVGVKLDAKGWDTMRLLAVDAWKEKG